MATRESSKEKFDAVAVICGDIEHQQRCRRRHFLPALLLTLASLLAMGVLMGLRPDLLDQPLWQLTGQASLWILCLIVLPGIGVGVFFPRRGTRVALGIGALVLTVAATLGWPTKNVGESLALGNCAMMVFGYAALVLLLGLFSGAFSQRRAASSACWIAAGIALTALNAVTWHCPMDSTAHIVSNHLGVAAALLVMVSEAGVIIHRRSRRRA